MLDKITRVFFIIIIGYLDIWIFEIGAGNEVRTRDLNLGKVALYQLSYSRIRGVLNGARGETWTRTAKKAEGF